MRDKGVALRAGGHPFEIVTQFAFDAAKVLKWIEAVRETGVEERIRIGIPGPAKVQTLLRFAARCGVEASGSVIAKYGLSLTKLLTKAGPEKFLTTFHDAYRAERHGDVRFHLYPFGGVRNTAQWLNQYRAR